MSDFRKEEPWRPPSLLLEADPPIHTRAREVVGPILSPRRLQEVREYFEGEAAALVDQLAELGEFDVVHQLAEAYSLKVFGDTVGLSDEGREHLLVYGDLVFNSFGPHNQLYEDSMANAQIIQQWVQDSCRREALRPGGFGEQIWALTDNGEVSEEWAALLVRSFLTAGILTMVNGITAAIYGFASHADQWNILRENPSLAASAFEEAVRWESPIQAFFRTTTQEVEVSGIRIPAEEKVMLFLGAANRDPRRWTKPDLFDIRRNPSGHVGFGMGIHRCIGQTLARLQAETLLIALARRVEQIEITGQPQRRPSNMLYAWKCLPVIVRPALA
jgi:cytochrome P450